MPGKRYNKAVFGYLTGAIREQNSAAMSLGHYKHLTDIYFEEDIAAGLFDRSFTEPRESTTTLAMSAYGPRHLEGRLQQDFFWRRSHIGLRKALAAPARMGAQLSHKSSYHILNALYIISRPSAEPKRDNLV